MKQTTVGVFEAREDAEKAVERVHTQFNIPSDDISFLYRTERGELHEVDSADVSGRTAAEGARSGVVTGGAIGLFAGLVVIAGLVPAAERLFTQGPIARLTEFLGITGAIGIGAVSTLVGAILGAVLGAIINGAARAKAVRYDDRAHAGEIMVAVNAPSSLDVITLFRRLGAFDARVYRLSI